MGTKQYKRNGQTINCIRSQCGRYVRADVTMMQVRTTNVERFESDVISARTWFATAALALFVGLTMSAGFANMNEYGTPIAPTTTEVNN